MKGLLIVLSGPSGVGKGTVRQVLMKDASLDLCYSVSMTTRKPRIGEINGQDYFFVNKEEFLKHIENNDLLEHAQFVDNYYGTPKAYVEKLRNEGHNVLLEIETNGARQVMEKVKSGLGYVPDDLAEELKKDYTDGIPYSYADEIISFWKNKENKENENII